MNLEAFVEQTLIAITRGVDTARRASPGVAPLLAPPGEDDDMTGLLFTLEGGNLQPVFMVDFDVAVSADHKTGSGVGGGIRVLEFVSADAKRPSEEHSSTVSRIKFKVPLRLTNPTAKPSDAADGEQACDLRCGCLPSSVRSARHPLRARRS